MNKHEQASFLQQRNPHLTAMVNRQGKGAHKSKKYTIARKAKHKNKER